MPELQRTLAAGISAIATLIIVIAASSAAMAGGSYKDVHNERWFSSHGFYIEGRLGGPINTEYDVDMTSPNVAGANGELGIDAGRGIGYGFSIGKQLSRLWRAEFAWNYASSDDLKIDFSGAPANPLAPSTLDSAGEMSVHTLMVSVFRSWDYQFLGRIRPFSGIGLGVAIIDVENAAPANARFVINDRDTVFAAALHSGVDIPLSDAAILTFRSDTILTTGGTFNAVDTNNAGGIMSVDSDTDITWALSAGLRIKLN